MTLTDGWNNPMYTTILTKKDIKSQCGDEENKQRYSRLVFAQFRELEISHVIMLSFDCL